MLNFACTQQEKQLESALYRIILIDAQILKGLKVKEYEVNCVNKPNRNSPHEHITHIGHTGNKWRLTREAAITRIDSKAEAFYTVDKATGKRVYIGVVREAGKAPYLRTYADGKWNDNLLAQTECGAECKFIG